MASVNVHTTLLTPILTASILSITAGLGHAAWNPDGVPACVASGSQVAPHAVPDGAGGVIVVWQDSRRGENTWDVYAQRTQQAYYAQHYSVGGSPQWPVDLPAPAYHYLEDDDSGGAYFIGRPFGLTGLEVHRRHGDATIPTGWTPAGVVVSRPTAMGNVSPVTFGGTLLLCWGENRSGAGHDVRSIAILPNGTVAPGWAPAVNPVCLAAGDQLYPELVKAGPNRAVACWQDERSGDWDIFVGAIDPDVPTTAVDTPTGDENAFALSGPWPNPVRDRAMVSFALAAGPAPTLEILDIAGRQVRRVEVGAVRASRQALAVDVGHLPSGVYLIRLTQAARSATRRFAIVR